MRREGEGGWVGEGLSSGCGSEAAEVFWRQRQYSLAWLGAEHEGADGGCPVTASDTGGTPCSIFSDGGEHRFYSGSSVF